MSFSASVNAASTGTTVAAGLNLTTWLEGPIFLHNEGIRATKISIIRGLEFLFRSTEDVLPDQIRSIWLEFRGRAIAPLLQAAVVLCLIVSVMLLVEAVYMSVVSLTVKLLRRKPQKRYKWEPIKEEVEIGSRYLSLSLSSGGIESLCSAKISIIRGLEFLFRSTEDVLPDQIRSIWLEFRGRAIAPLLQAAVVLCLIMSVMLLVEAVYMSAVSLTVKLLRRKPQKRYKWEPIKEDVEIGSRTYPMVLVQIPMYNEKEVYKLSIGAACGLTWPPEQIIIQVLDDSTDQTVKDLVELECKVWASKGINIKYEVRDNRKGYKAGALKAGMVCDYVQQCDFVAIFDADFQPEADFLIRTIPFLIQNPKIALVQARWEFGNC